LIHFTRQEYQQALNEAEPLIESPVNEESFIYIAGIHDKLQQYEKALAVLKQGIKKFPASPELQFNKGVFQEKLGDIEACIETMRAVIALSPDFSAAYNYIGYILAEREEDLAEAEKLLDKALELKPGDGYYLDSLGWIYFKQGQLEKAEKTLKQSVETVPEEGVVWYHLGEVFLAKGERDKALDAFRKALSNSLEGEEREKTEQRIEELDSDD
jgi:tetratricopeptide (TPR) repeat protein